MERSQLIFLTKVITVPFNLDEMCVWVGSGVAEGHYENQVDPINEWRMKHVGGIGVANTQEHLEVQPIYSSDPGLICSTISWKIPFWDLQVFLEILRKAGSRDRSVALWDSMIIT